MKRDGRLWFIVVCMFITMVFMGLRIDRLHRQSIVTSVQILTIERALRILSENDVELATWLDDLHPGIEIEFVPYCHKCYEEN